MTRWWSARNHRPVDSSKQVHHGNFIPCSAETNICGLSRLELNNTACSFASSNTNIDPFESADRYKMLLGSSIIGLYPNVAKVSTSSILSGAGVDALVESRQTLPI